MVLSTDLLTARQHSQFGKQDIMGVCVQKSYNSWSKICLLFCFVHRTHYFITEGHQADVKHHSLLKKSLFIISDFLHIHMFSVLGNISHQNLFHSLRWVWLASNYPNSPSCFFPSSSNKEVNSTWSWWRCWWLLSSAPCSVKILCFQTLCCCFPECNRFSLKADSKVHH